MKLESRTGRSTASATQMFRFISDFRNFDAFIPQDKVSNWSAEKEFCSFKVDVAGTIALRQVETQEPSLIKMTTDQDSTQYNFTLWLQIKEVEDGESRFRLTLEPHVSGFLLPIIKGPLKQFIESLITEMESFDFPEA